MIDIDVLKKVYFWLDEPVPYKLAKDKEILIYPIGVKDSELFLSCADLISIDKNSLSDAKFISMSYLEFITMNFIFNENEQIAQVSRSKLGSLFKMCLHKENNITIGFNERKKPVIYLEDCQILPKHFEDIRRIILYQNLIDFDDSYVSPDVREAVEELNELKNKNIEIPTMERKIAIITAHTGILKQSQLEMTYRTHSNLFKEVYGEVDYSTLRTAALIGNMFSKKQNEIEDWIYKKKHGKFDNYFVSKDEFENSMGGAISIRSENP